MTQELFPMKVVYPKPPPLDVYIVTAYWAPGGWWKVFTQNVPPLHTDKEAQEFADSLGQGYTVRKIFHLVG